MGNHEAAIQFFTLILGFGLLILIFWLFALIDILKSEFSNPQNKMVWLLTVILLGPLGSTLYMFIGNDQKVKKEKRRDKGEISVDACVSNFRSRDEKYNGDFEIR